MRSERLFLPSIGVIASIVMVGAIGIGILDPEYSTGERVGQLTKFSRKGLICKTWEGELLMGGLKKQTTYTSTGNGENVATQNMVANTFEFSVTDPKVIAELQKQMGANIKLSYTERMGLRPCQRDTGYVIVGIN